MPAIACSRKRARRRPSPRAIEIFRRHQILGQSQREVAKAMGCSAPRVHQVCRAVSCWVDELPAEANIPATRVQHDLIFRFLLAETFAAWDRTKQPLKTTKAKIVRGRVNEAGKALPDLVTSEQIEREQCGDPRFLQLAEQLLKSQRAMWGADAPKHHEHSGPDGGPIGIAAILQHVALNPPSPPTVIDVQPANVFDTEAVLRQIQGPKDEDSPCWPPNGG